MFAPRNHPSYVAVGSVVTRARRDSTVWGSGSFGSERRSLFKSSAEYRAVRGPLTRSRLLDVGIDCPRVYGDPALLVPMHFWPEVEQTHEVGIVIRHSEHLWRDVAPGRRRQGDRLRFRGHRRGHPRHPGVPQDHLLLSARAGHRRRLRDPERLAGDRRPRRWRRPNGGEFEHLDYFASVNKLRQLHHVDLRGGSWTPESLAEKFEYDDRPIEFDYTALLDACPFVVRADRSGPTKKQGSNP